MFRRGTDWELVLNLSECTDSGNRWSQRVQKGGFLFYSFGVEAVS